MYSNTAGRRDMAAIPGNANMIAKFNPAWQAGYTIDYQAKYNEKTNHYPNKTRALGPLNGSLELSLYNYLLFSMK